MNYIHDTMDLIAMVGIDDVFRVFTWIDAAHAVHSNMRSHTGGACAFGVRVFSATSSKQKLNAKISTKSEIVGNSGK